MICFNNQMMNLGALAIKSRPAELLSVVIIVSGCIYTLIALNISELRIPMTMEEQTLNRSEGFQFSVRTELELQPNNKLILYECVDDIQLGPVTGTVAAKQHVDSYFVQFLSRVKHAKRFLTLGLSTVHRENTNYLPQTIDSLISRMDEKEKNHSVIVIFIASDDVTLVNNTLTMIDQKYQESLTSGLLQVIQPDSSIYPDFTAITKRNFNDKLERVHWRTKQNIDFAHLFGYCDQISDYYLHLEDDVLAATDYIRGIRNFVAKNRNGKWLLLEFSSLGFIGKLFKSSDLCMLKRYMLLFKEEKPCDLLLSDLQRIMANVKRIRNPVSLFQHIGLTSSLKGKIQKLRDKRFKDKTTVRRPKI